jgi:hypothetical protein
MTSQRRPRGRPRDTPLQRQRRQENRVARRRQLQRAAQRLRVAAAQAATRGPRRSLRIEWHYDNDHLIAAGHEPLYYLVLYGERGWNVDQGEDHQILVNY